MVSTQITDYRTSTKHHQPTLNVVEITFTLGTIIESSPIHSPVLPIPIVKKKKKTKTKKTTEATTATDNNASSQQEKEQEEEQANDKGKEKEEQLEREEKKEESTTTTAGDKEEEEEEEEEDEEINDVIIRFPNGVVIYHLSVPVGKHLRSNASVSLEDQPSSPLTNHFFPFSKL